MPFFPKAPMAKSGRTVTLPDEANSAAASSHWRQQTVARPKKWYKMVGKGKAAVTIKGIAAALTVPRTGSQSSGRCRVVSELRNDHQG